MKTSPPLPLLALDTSGQSCSAALCLPGDRLLSRITHEPRQHTRALFAFIEALLAESQLSRQDIACLACGQGPGAFTGLRIAIAVTQGLGLALGVPILPVNTLQAIAADGASIWLKQGNTLAEGSSVLVASDARMNEFYAQWFRWHAGLPVPLNSPKLLDASGLSHELKKRQAGLLCGNGFAAELPAITHATDFPVIPHAFSHAEHIARLARQMIESGDSPLTDPSLLQPVYVRDRVTHQR